jgi:hypothetical protein
VVAVGVVDDLELVDVAEDDGEGVHRLGAVLADGALDALGLALVEVGEGAAVVEAGERVARMLGEQHVRHAQALGHDDVQRVAERPVGLYRFEEGGARQAEAADLVDGDAAGRAGLAVQEGELAESVADGHPGDDGLGGGAALDDASEDFDSAVQDEIEALARVALVDDAIAGLEDDDLGGFGEGAEVRGGQGGEERGAGEHAGALVHRDGRVHHASVALFEEAVHVYHRGEVYAVSVP